MFGLAHRLLGSAQEAEDAYLRWDLCLNRLTSVACGAGTAGDPVPRRVRIMANPEKLSHLLALARS